MTSSEAVGHAADPTPKDLTAPIVLSALLALVWLLALSLLGPAAYLVPFGLLIAAGAVWFMSCAMRGESWALAGLVGFAMVVPNINFQTQALHEAASLTAQNGLKLLLWTAMGLIALARLPHCLYLLQDRAIQLISLFGLLATASIMWSPVAIYTAVAAMGFVAALLFCCAVAAEVTEETIFRTVAVSFVIYVTMNILAVIALPDVAWSVSTGDNDPSRFQGVSSHPNVLGKEMAAFICIFLPLAMVRGARRSMYALTTLAILMIVATNSRTSLVAIAITLALPFLIRPHVAKTLAWLSMAVVGLALLIAASGFAPDVRPMLDGLSRSRDASEILTLTGRTELWGFVWDKILEAPLLGYGFGSADAVLSRDWWGPPDASVGAHNTWLQSLLMLGFLGTAPFIAFHGELMRRWIAAPHSYIRLISPYLLIHGMAEVEIAAHPALLTFAVFMIAAMDAKHNLRPTEGS